MILSKHDSMSPSSTHCGAVVRHRSVKTPADGVGGGAIRSESIGVPVRCASRRLVPARAGVAPASHGPSSSGFPAVASYRCFSGCTPVSADAAYSRAALSDNMALHLVSGVDHANSVHSRRPFAVVFSHSLHGQGFAAHERVSRRCKALTLRRLPSCLAFTIRDCRLLTRRWQSDHLMSRQSVVEPERACAAGRSSARLSVNSSRSFS